MEGGTEMGPRLAGCIFPTHALEKLASAAITVDDADRTASGQYVQDAIGCMQLEPGVKLPCTIT